MRSFPTSLAALAALHLLVVAAPAQNPQPRSDFVFLVDDSDSMGAEIRNIRNALPAFVVDLQNNNVDHAFAVVRFGDEPRLLLDITSDVGLIQAALDSLTTPRRAREAGLEAIRMALGESTVPLVGGPVSWRPNSIKNLILVTDEDSDQPFYVANRLPGQTTTQPPTWSTLNDWQREVDDTAAAVLRNNAHLNLLINQQNRRTIFQYGAWVYSQQTPSGSYDRAATLQALQNGGIGRCLEAQILAAGALARCFDVTQLRQNTTFVQQFFATKLEETLCPCASTATWSNYGSGWPGTNGVPTLALSAAPSLCSNVDALLGNSRGAPTPCCLFYSDAPADRATQFGGRLLIDDRSPFFLETGVFVGSGGSALPLRIPCNQLALCGLTFHLQAVLLDPGASHGIAASPGLALTLGN